MWPARANRWRGKVINYSGDEYKSSAVNNLACSVCELYYGCYWNYVYE